MSSYRLPNEDYKYQLSLFSNFNNQLLSGINSGLSLYDKDTDTKLYKPTDYKPLDDVNFNTINNDLDKYDKNYNINDDIYNNSKSSVAGVIAGISKTIDNSLEKVKNDIFNFEGIKTYAGLFLLFLILIKFK